MTAQERKWAIRVGARYRRVLECRRQLSQAERRYADAQQALARAELEAGPANPVTVAGENAAPLRPGEFWTTTPNGRLVKAMR